MRAQNDEDARSCSRPRFLRKKIVRCNAGGFPYRLPRRGRFRSEDDGERYASRETPGRERGSHPRNGGAACGLRRCGRAAGGAPSPADGHGGVAARPAGQGVGRIHRPLRGDRHGRCPGAGLRLSPGDQFRRRRDGRGRRGALHHRSASLSDGGRSGAGRSRRGECPERMGDRAARTRAIAYRKRHDFRGDARRAPAGSGARPRRACSRRMRRCRRRS